jgi:deoxyribodipyrimidine photo-lyase
MFSWLAMKDLFPTDFRTIQERLNQIKPIEYCSTRNYIDGDVTYLSPYISRGVFSTAQVFKHCVNSGLELNRIEKFIQELAWRDYWQRVWQEKDVDKNLKNRQKDVRHFEIPKAILDGKTGIDAIDKAILEFYETGYLHNHVRMYIAFLTTNLGKANWKLPAQWMYYHLLDADWASNALSWQWVCGANSNKKYVANQENINRYCYTNQKGTYLDKSYEDLMEISIPKEFSVISLWNLKTVLPEKVKIEIDKKSTALYTWYNMDPHWRKNENLNRVLILEPSHFDRYPISQKSMKFLLDLGKNIENLQIYTGDFAALKAEFPETHFIYKEHPTNMHFQGTEDQRDWLSSVSGYYPSFFGFWKKVRKELFE